MAADDPEPDALAICQLMLRHRMIKASQLKGLLELERPGESYLDALQRAEVIDGPQRKRIVRWLAKARRERAGQAPPDGGDELSLLDDDGAPSRVEAGATVADAQVATARRRTAGGGGGDAAAALLGKIDKLQGSFRRYRIERHLGRGATGRVELAQDRLLRRQTALKICVRSEAKVLARFLREARIGSRLDHPNIAPIYDCGLTAEGEAYFAMKYIDGTPLDELIERLAEGDAEAQRRYPLRRRLSIFAKVLEGVAYAHARRVIHRDLKPANIMIGAFGEVLVVDWGLAKQLDIESETDQAQHSGSVMSNVELADLADTSRTHDGAVIGTPAYMSPEQARGASDELRASSDIFALGSILYELGSLKRAFPQRDAPSLLAAILSRKIRSPRLVSPGSGVDRGLEAIVYRAMALEPAQRYPSVEAMLADVQAWLDDREVSAHTPPLHERAARWVRRHQTAALAAVGVLFVLTVMFALLASEGRARAESERRKRVAEQGRAAALADAERAATQRASALDAAREQALQRAAAERKQLEAERELRRLAAQRAAQAEQARAQLEKRQAAAGLFLLAQAQLNWSTGYAHIDAAVIPTLERALEADPTYVEARLQLVQLMAMIDRGDAEVQAELMEMIPNLPEESRVKLTKLVNMIMIAKMSNGKITIPDNLDSLQPSVFSEIHWQTLLALLFHKAGQTERALKALASVLALPEAQLWETYFLEASILAEAERYPAALAKLEALLARKPRLIVALNMKSQVLSMMGRTAQADRVATDALALDPSCWTAWRRRAANALNAASARKDPADQLERRLTAVRFMLRAAAARPHERYVSKLREAIQAVARQRGWKVDAPWAAIRDPANVDGLVRRAQAAPRLRVAVALWLPALRRLAAADALREATGLPAAELQRDLRRLEARHAARCLAWLRAASTDGLAAADREAIREGIAALGGSSR